MSCVPPFEHQGVQMIRERRLAAAPLWHRCLRAAFLCCVALSATSLSSGAQAAPDDERTGRFRDPRTASYWSIIPGGGHLYAGEYDKGIAFFGGSIALLAAGHRASQEKCALFDAIDQSRDELQVIRACERQRGWFALSVVAASGLWLAGIFDAADSAHRANFRNGWTGRFPLTVDVALAPDLRGASLGARIAFR